MKLESPNGSLYYVEVTERYSKMVLRHGWEAFINAHHIEENDFLLFRHIDSSLFEVLILDSDGCEKLVACASIENIPCVGERSIDCLDISSSSEHNSTESSGRQRFTRSTKCCSHRSGQSIKKIVALSSSENSGEDFPSENQSFWISRGADYVLSRGSSLSEAQKERVLVLIQEIKPEITVFVAIMRKTNVQPPSICLVISKEYALIHFPQESMDVTLRRPGKSKKWQVRFYKRKDNTLCMLRGRWLDFVADNNVQEGDICLFLPLKGGRKFTFMVYILRTNCTIASRSRTKTRFQRIGRSSAEMASGVHIKEESTEGENFSMENHRHETSQECQESDSGGPADPLYIVPFKSHLSQSQKTIVEARVQRIQSEFPIFGAIMTKGRIGDAHNGMIELGARLAAQHLPNRQQIVVLQCMGKIWKTKMVVLASRRWFLKGGWPTFVRGNGLRIGDICLFDLKKNERKVTMEVHIIFHEQF